MPYSTNVIKLLEEVEPSLRKVLIALLEEIERQREESVTRRVFMEFARHTEENFQKVWKSIQELTEAQKKSEERLTRVERAVEELAEAQKRTEQRVEELAEAQRRTEERLTRVERAVEELAEAQRRTEEELKTLIHEHAETRRQLGGLSNTVGYTLENEAYRALPGLLKRDHGIKIEGRLKRGYLKDREGRYIEVNIIGDGRLNGKKIKIIGEGKAQLSKNEVNDFIRKKLKRLEGVFKEIFPVLVTHMTTAHDVEDYALKKGLRIYYSYDF